LEVRGTEDGRFRAEALAAGTVTADAPARIAFVAGSTSPDTVRAGATIPVTVSIRNEAPGGGSSFVIDPAATRIRISDGVESAVAYGTGAPFSLAPGATATLSFPSVPFPSALASQPYPVALDVQGTEWGQAESTTVLSAAGEIEIVEPVPAVQVRGLDPGTPKQAAPGASFPFWTLELLPLIPPGGAASSRLVAIAITVLADGAVTPNPSALLAQLTLRDEQGALLAQAAPGSANPVLLVLATPLPLTGPAAPLRIEAALQPTAAAGALALRLAQDTDLDVRDDLTQTSVPIVSAGGQPFQSLTSGTVTLFAKPHGYPNPFRAGREDVLLSYHLSGDASVQIAIFTLLGDRVRELTLPAGAPGGSAGLNEVRWDGRNRKGELVRPGVYVARVEGGGVSEQIKVGVLR
jgi:hypothetical protein